MQARLPAPQQQLVQNITASAAGADAHVLELAETLWARAIVGVTVRADLPQALDSVTEAIHLYHALTEQSPQRAAGRWSSAYRTLADVLDALGRGEEAAELRHQLDEGNPPAAPWRADG